MASSILAICVLWANGSRNSVPSRISSYLSAMVGPGYTACSPSRLHFAGNAADMIEMHNTKPISMKDWADTTLVE